MNTPAEQSTPSLQEIYAELEKGAGHQWVTDDNVHDLIAMAKDKGNALVETTLREWQAPCTPEPGNE